MFFIVVKTEGVEIDRELSLLAGAVLSGASCSFAQVNQMGFGSQETVNSIDAIKNIIPLHPTYVPEDFKGYDPMELIRSIALEGMSIGDKVVLLASNAYIENNGNSLTEIQDEISANGSGFQVINLDDMIYGKDD